jgi:RNA polymerase sigma-70 factor (ECF subfamily)
MVERRLVELAQRGDEGAFSELALAISPRLFAIAQRVLRDFHAAEDATQGALVQIWRKLPSLEDADRFDAWSYRVLINQCYSEGRRERRRPTLVVFNESDVLSADGASSVADRDMLERAFVRMPAEQRAVLVLAYYLEFGYTEIADVPGIPVGTVKSRASSGRNAMPLAFDHWKIRRGDFDPSLVDAIVNSFRFID